MGLSQSVKYLGTAADSGTSCSISSQKLGVCMVKCRKPHARRHLLLIGDHQDEPLETCILNQTSPAHTEARVFLLTGDQTVLKSKAGINGEK